jgi:hypothetical protein
MYKKYEQSELKLKTNQTLIADLTREKTELGQELEKSHMNFNELRIKFENSACLIQHSFQTGALIKEEKDSLEKQFNSLSAKFKSIKDENEKFKTLNESLTLKCKDLDTSCESFKSLNEIKIKENEVYLAVSEINFYVQLFFNFSSFYFFLKGIEFNKVRATKQSTNPQIIK